MIVFTQFTELEQLGDRLGRLEHGPRRKGRTELDKQRG